MLSYKANGAKSSPELITQIYKDIALLKEIGIKAKDEADFIRKMERKEKIDELQQGIDKMVADKTTIKTKIGNTYRAGFTNIYSMINSMFGKSIAEKYNPDISENNRDTAIYNKTKEVAGNVTKIYGEKNINKRTI